MNLNAFTQFFEGKVKYSASFQMSSKMLKMGITEESFFLKLKKKAWRIRASIPLPRACEARALPSELNPHMSRGR